LSNRPFCRRQCSGGGWSLFSVSALVLPALAVLGYLVRAPRLMIRRL